VLSIRGAGGSVLLPGDVGRVVERRLVAQGLAPHEVLLAAHHGSRSSSDPALLRVLEPRWVLIAAGAGNRFGFPHPEVLDRLERSAERVLSTADCGAVRLELVGNGQVEAISARRTRAAPWRWPAAPACP
jgi:competence protein ComEC